MLAKSSISSCTLSRVIYFFSFILPQNQKTFYLEFYFRGYKSDANLFTPFIILYWTEAYLGTRQESAIEVFPKIINNSKWLSVRLQTKWLWVRIPLQSLKLHISRLFQTKISLTFTQVKSVDSLLKRVCDMIRTHNQTVNNAFIKWVK